MLLVFLVGVGGFLGAVSRYLLGGWVHDVLRSPWWPYGTFAVNIVGCLLIGFFVGMGDGVRVTEDGGATWRSVLRLRAPGLVTGLSLSGSRLVAVSDEQAPNATPSGTVLGVYLTRDGGMTWDTLAVPASASGGIALAIGAGSAAFIGTRSGLWSVLLQ